MMYYAYENWRAHGHVTKVHRQDCVFCNHGKGLAGGTRGDNGTWVKLGDLPTPHEALALTKRKIRSGEIRFCRTCLRDV